MKSLFVAASVAAVALATPATAQTAGGGKAFEGPYVGAQIGYTHDKYRQVGSDLGEVGIYDSRDSFVGGVYGGYDHHVADRVVVGLEGGFDIGAKDGRKELREGQFSEINPRFTFTATARAGYQITPTTLVYARAGYEGTDARVTLANVSGTNRDSRFYSGWIVGGGAERYITTNVSARVEYRYSELGGDDTHWHRQQALLGVSYHF